MKKRETEKHNENNTEDITFVKWITRNGEKIYPPHGKKAWPLKGHKKK